MQQFDVLIALLVCLIPTTNGGLISTISIAGMDRLIQRTVIALSGRAIEAAGDVDVLLLDKTSTITQVNRQAVGFITVVQIIEQELVEAAQLPSLADETPAGRSIVVLDKEKYGLRERSPYKAGAFYLIVYATFYPSTINRAGRLASSIRLNQLFKSKKFYFDGSSFTIDNVKP